jgi:dihydrofolate reductase
MGKVQAQAAMSLDGYVAKQDNTIDALFDWLQNGEVEIPTPAGDFAVHVTPASSEHMRQWMSSLGALVCGRELFDMAEGWQGRHTLDVPVVVVTHRVPTDWVDAHPDAPFSFVTGSWPSPGEPSPGSAWNWDCSTKWPSIWSRW